MILVTLGTQDKEFSRLLQEIEKQIDLGNIKEEVYVQSGKTEYKSKKMEIFNYMTIEQFYELIKKSNLIITHGGVATIIEGLKNNKKVIAVPRLKKYKEHVNNHQLQIIENFNEEGYIIGIKDVSELEEALRKVDDFNPKKYKSNTKEFIKELENQI